MERVDTFILILILEEILAFSPLFSVMLAICLLHILFIILRGMFFLFLISLGIFIIKGHWSLWRALSVLKWSYYDFRESICCIRPIFIDLFWTIHTPWSETLILAENFEIVLLNSFCKCFIENFCFYTHLEKLVCVGGTEILALTEKH